MYKQKYIKYKTKYRNLNNGFANKKLPIVHIAGASGSGKTFLGKKLVDALGNKVIIKDLDDLREEHFLMNENTDISFNDFIKNYEPSYQKYIDNFIKEHNSVPIIFVGINTYIMGENFYFKNTEGKYPPVFFDLHADYKYYIDVDENTILKQRFDREFDNYINWFCDWMKKRKNILFNNLLENENEAKKDVCTALTRIMNFSKIKEDIKKWNDYYRSKGYTFLSMDQIYNDIIKKFK